MTSFAPQFGMTCLWSFLALLLVFPRPRSDVECMRKQFYLAGLYANTLFTCVIPESLDLAAELGYADAYQAAQYSALMIGLSQGGKGVAYLPLFFLTRWHGEAWLLKNAQTILLVAGILQSTGTFVFVVCGFNSRTWSSAHIFLLLGRLILGCGAGAALFLSRLCIARTCPKSEQPQYFSTNIFYRMLGLAFGPLFSAGTRWVLIRMGDEKTSEGAGSLQVGICMAMLASAAILPEPVVYEAASVAKQHSEMDAAKRKSHKVGIICCCIVALIRSMVVAGLEAATALIFESEPFKWDTSLAGMTVSLTFLACIPQRVLYARFQTRLSTVTWIRLSMICSLIGSLMLLEFVSKIFGTSVEARVAMLILADTVLFPSFMLASGLTEGLAQTLSLSEGSAFSPANVAFMLVICIDVLGRFPGPYFARTHIAAQGQDGYAMQQFILSLLCIGILELAVYPHLRVARPDQFQRVSGSSPPLVQETELSR